MSSMGVKKPLEGNGDVWGMNKGGLGKVVDQEQLILTKLKTTYGSCIIFWGEIGL